LGGTEAALALGIWYHSGDGKGQHWAVTWAHIWSWLSGVHGRAGQGCGELETGSAAMLLWQGLMALVGWHGVLGHGPCGEEELQRG